MTRRPVDVGEVTLSIEEQGEGDVVVLLHGFPETAHSWRHQLPALAAAGYHAVARTCAGPSPRRISPRCRCPPRFSGVRRTPT